MYRGRVFPRRTSRAIGLAVFLTLPARCLRAQVDWIAGDGNWSNPGNWSTSTIPGNGDAVKIVNTDGTSPTIAYDYLGPAVTLGQLVVSGSGGTEKFALATAGSNLVTHDQLFGDSGNSPASAGVASVTQSAGTNSSLGNMYLGYDSLDQGTYSLGGSSTLSLGASGPFSAGNEFIGYLGSGGFNQTGGINSMAGLALHLAYYPTATGTYVLTGGSLVTANEIIGEGGHGTFLQSGGVNIVNGSLVVDENAEAQAEAEDVAESTYTLYGTGKIVADYELISNSFAGHFDQSQGTNEVDRLVLGNVDQATGTYTLSGEGTLTAGSETIGSQATGIFVQSGGINTANDLSIADMSGSSGEYTLLNNALLTVTGYEIVGTEGIGIFDQSGGYNSAMGGLNIGGNSGATGTYILDGNGTLMASAIAIAIGGAKGLLAVCNSANLSVAGSLQIGANGRFNLNSATASVGNLIVCNGGVADINATLQINYTSPANDPVTSILSYLQSGYSNGSWSGTSGIISTTVSSGPASPLLSIGYADGNTDTNTAATPNQILVKLTLAGDANLDGFVNFADLVAVIQNFNKSNTDWSQGNFTYANSTSFADLVLLIQNFNKQMPPPNSSGQLLGISTIQLTDVQLPEPAGLTSFAAAAIFLTRRRRK